MDDDISDDILDIEDDEYIYGQSHTQQPKSTQQQHSYNIYN